MEDRPSVEGMGCGTVRYGTVCALERGEGGWERYVKYGYGIQEHFINPRNGEPINQTREANPFSCLPPRVHVVRHLAINSSARDRNSSSSV